MPRPTLQITSLGSVWLIDENEKMYCRFPRTEGPRSSPLGEDWGGPNAGPLQDAVWHPYTDWYIHRGRSRLIIETGVPNEAISAPVSRDVVEQHAPETLARDS